MKKYLCFTTIPPRFSKLKDLTDMFLKYDIDQIRIYIPQNYIRFSDKRYKEMKLPEFENEKIKILNIKKDYGPFTKTIGPMLDKEINDDDCVIITDDDSFKHDKWLDNMLKVLEKFKDCIIQTSNKVNTQIHGSSGFCFIKKTMKKKNFIKFINKIPLNYYFIDDDVLTVYLNFKKIKIIKTIKIYNKKHFTQIYD